MPDPPPVPAQQHGGRYSGRVCWQQPRPPQPLQWISRIFRREAELRMSQSFKQEQPSRLAQLLQGLCQRLCRRLPPEAA